MSVVETLLLGLAVAVSPPENDVTAGARFCRSLLKYPETTQALVRLKVGQGWRRTQADSNESEASGYSLQTFSKAGATVIIGSPKTKQGRPYCQFTSPIEPSQAAAAMIEVDEVYREIAATYSKNRPFEFQSFNGDKVVGRLDGNRLVVTVTRKPAN